MSNQSQRLVGLRTLQLTDIVTKRVHSLTQSLSESTHLHTRGKYLKQGSNHTNIVKCWNEHLILMILANCILAKYGCKISPYSRTGDNECRTNQIFLRNSPIKIENKVNLQIALTYCFRLKNLRRLSSYLIKMGMAQ